MTVKDIIQREIDAFNRHDAGALASGFTDEAVVHDPQYDTPLRGRDAIRTDMESWFRAFPDVRSEIRNVLEDGDTYATEIRMTGTHRGPLSTPDGDIEPTGRRVEMSVGFFGKTDGDRIVEERRYYDMAALGEQLGVTG